MAVKILHTFLAMAVFCMPVFAQSMALVRVGSYSLVGAEAVYVEGSRAYVAHKTAGLKIIDVANPAAPVLLGSYNTPGSARDVFAAGAYAYVADNDQDLQVIDVSNPAAPVFAGSCAVTGNCHDIWVAGSIAYLADNAQGIRVINVADAAHPALVTSFPTGSIVQDIQVAGNYAYLAQYSGGPSVPGGVSIVDVSSPAAPVLAAFYQQHIYSYDVCVSGNFLYIANWYNGLVIVDISDPRSPAYAGARATAGYTGSVGVEGTNVFAGTGSHCLDCFSAAKPESTVAYKGVNTTGNPVSIHAANGYVYVIDDAEGLLIFQLVPNSILVRPRLQQNGRGFFSAAGRGVYFFDVLGRDIGRARATDAPSGAYFCRPRAQEPAATIKLLVKK